MPQKSNAPIWQDYVDIGPASKGIVPFEANIHSALQCKGWFYEITCIFNGFGGGYFDDDVGCRLW